MNTKDWKPNHKEREPRPHMRTLEKFTGCNHLRRSRPRSQEKNILEEEGQTLWWILSSCFAHISQYYRC